MKWAKSNVISNALLTCPRLKGMARQAMRRSQVQEQYLDEVISECALIIQTRCIAGGLAGSEQEKGKIQNIGDIYFIIFKTLSNICLNYGKKTSRTNFAIEKNFSSLEFEDESDEDLIGKYSNECAIDIYDDVDKKIDMDLARKRLKDKLAHSGWPKMIAKERSAARGRPTLAEKAKK